MNTNYWVKDTKRKKVITKTKIPNAGNYKLFATYYNMIDTQGLSCQFDLSTEMQVEKLFMKNSFQYIFLETNGVQELYILPCKGIFELTERVISQIDHCNNETDVLSLLIDMM
ncbi:MAG: hypothetical protein JJT94_06095 [Bernardetiaceae bacterium]|nr:hypothetical protein [Bernardetiaceae bacterium]